MIYAAIFLSYFIYSFLEAISIFPRLSGAVIEKNSLGYSFSAMVNTVKRIFIVIYPPLLGWLAIKNVNLYEVFYVSYFLGVLAIVIVYINRDFLLYLFINILFNYSSKNKMNLKLFTLNFSKNDFHELIISKVAADDRGVDVKLVCVSTWIYFVYGSSLFFINLLGALFIEYSSMIYQSIGLINALGTLFMSFILDPKISFNYDKKSDIMKTKNSLIMGQFLAMGIMGPFFILIISNLYSK